MTDKELLVEFLGFDLAGFDLGVEPDGYESGTMSNPVVAALPAHWVAPFPDGYVEAVDALAELRAEGTRVDDAIKAATRAGDGAQVVELRSRRAVLPHLVEVAELELNRLQLIHLQACAALIAPVEQALNSVLRRKQDDLGRARLAVSYVSQAALSLTGARHIVEDKLESARRHQLELLYPESFVDAMEASVQAEAAARHETWIADTNMQHNRLEAVRSKHRAEEQRDKEREVKALAIAAKLPAGKNGRRS